MTEPKITYYWSRSPGKFVNKETGSAVVLASKLSAGPMFTGSVREWYETLVEICVDVHNKLFEMKGPQELGKPGKKVKPPQRTKLFTGSDVMTILEQTSLFKINGEFLMEYKKKGIGYRKIPPEALMENKWGELAGRFDVYKHENKKSRDTIVIEYEGLVGIIKVLDLNII